MGHTRAGTKGVALPAWLGFRQRPLHPPLRRLRFRLLGWLSNRPPNTKRMYVVSIGDRRFKRVVFPDSHHAEIAAERLEAFGPSGIYPALVLQRERELWVEWVEGEPLREADREVVAGLADLFAVLYGRDPRIAATLDTPFAWGLHRDLRFLRDAGVIAPGVYRVLDEIAHKLTPKQVWVGHDCTDAILKNFVRDARGRVRAIDVESLGAEQLLGIGVAKAAVRWLGPWRAAFLAELRAREVPDFHAYFPFVEMCFVAFWQKSSFLEKERRFVDPALFDRFLGH
jgi:hypothetical protein